MGIRPFVGLAIGVTIAIGITGAAETVVEPISLPESLRVSLNADPTPTEEPVSAEEPCNVRQPAIRPDAILKSLQESVERLSAAGLDEEAAEAAQLLKKFEQKHQTRLILELQNAEFARHRTELDRLQRRLAFFDTDADFERRLQRVSRLLSPQAEATEVRYWARDDGGDNIARVGQQSLNDIQLAPEVPVRASNRYYEKSVDLIDDITPQRRRLDSANWKGDFSVRRY